MIKSRLQAAFSIAFLCLLLGCLFPVLRWSDPHFLFECAVKMAFVGVADQIDDFIDWDIQLLQVLFRGSEPDILQDF